MNVAIYFSCTSLYPPSDMFCIPICRVDNIPVEWALLITLLSACFLILIGPGMDILE